MKIRNQFFKKRHFLFGLLILCCFFLVHPTPSSAADKIYTINVEKTTPAAAEKKLRKMKASSKQQLQLRINVSGEKGYKKDIKKIKIGGRTWNVVQSEAVASNEKLARAKVERWMKQFQNLKSNKYGILPVSYSKNTHYFRDSTSSGTFLIHPNGGCYVSDYVNMSTICQKAYEATQGKCEYRSEYIEELMQREQFSYLTVDNRRVHVDQTEAILAVDNMLQNIPVKQYSPAALKKQSDSIRVQCLLYGIPKAKLFVMDSDTSKKTQNSLYDIAKGKGRMRSYQNNEYWDAHYWAYRTWAHLSGYLSIDIKIKAWSGGYLNPRSASIYAKNADGNWDYYEVCDEIIRPQNKHSKQYAYMEEHLSDLKKNKHTQEYNWITKGKNTEADTAFIKKALQCFQDGTYIDVYMQIGPRSDQPIKLKIINNHPTKYGFTSASYTINYYETEDRQPAWSWTKD